MEGKRGTTTAKALDLAEGPFCVAGFGVTVLACRFGFVCFGVLAPHQGGEYGGKRWLGLACCKNQPQQRNNTLGFSGIKKTAKCGTLKR